MSGQCSGELGAFARGQAFERVGFAEGSSGNSGFVMVVVVLLLIVMMMMMMMMMVV